MDAVRYLEETRRMCRFFSHVACVGCPALINRQYCMFADMIVNYGTKTTDAVAIVEKWSEEHPRKKRQSVFLEQYPETIVDVHGVLRVCPMYISAAHRDSDGECKYPKKPCADCRREFWMQEVEL